MKMGCWSVPVKTRRVSDRRTHRVSMRESAKNRVLTLRTVKTGSNRQTKDASTPLVMVADGRQVLGPTSQELRILKIGTC